MSSEQFDYEFTVFTPTYNRAHTLHRPYDSLNEVVDDDFEWLIVDDKSDDGTIELLTEWKEEADYPIRVLTQERRGKHFAFNKGVRNARGRFFVPLDSDDKILPDALQSFRENWCSIPEEMRDEFAGMVGLCVDQNGNQVSKAFPAQKVDASPMEMRYKYGVKRDTREAFRTTILREYPFPEIEGVRFVPESYIWDTIGQNYLFRHFNETVQTVWIDERADQLTSPDSLSETAITHSLLNKFRLNNQMRWFRHDPVEFLKMGVNYSRFSFHNHDTPREQIRRLNNIPAVLLCISCIIPGYVLYRIEV